MKAVEGVKIREIVNNGGGKQPMPTFEELLADQGGYGRFQLFSNMIIILAVNTSGWMVYCQFYLLLYPKFYCPAYADGSDDYKNKCIPSYFC